MMIGDDDGADAAAPHDFAGKGKWFRFPRSSFPAARQHRAYRIDNRSDAR